MTLETITFESSIESIAAAIAKSRSSVWVGALSFEDRCRASLLSLARTSVEIDLAIAMDYTTFVQPEQAARRKRSLNWELIKEAQTRETIKKLQKESVDPYAFNDGARLVTKVAESGADFAIFDITCMTKIHVLALAATLGSRNWEFDWALAYSIPENYSSAGLPEGDPVSQGWRDVIVAPLRETAEFFNEASSRGIVLLGHQPGRVIVGLSEIEPTGGAIILPRLRSRPDMLRAAERANKRLIQRLQKSAFSQWRKRVVESSDTAGLLAMIDSEIRSARVSDSPLVLFPYGPKPLVFEAARACASRYPRGSWFVYPVPASYDAFASEGIERTMWIASDRRTESAVPVQIAT